MKKISVGDAIGQTICHDMTRIVRGEMKGAQFKRGHVIRETDIPLLLDMGKTHIYIWDDDENLLHENDAAERLAAMCVNNNMKRSAVSEGKIEINAAIDGLFRVDTDKLREINMITDVMIATRHTYSQVKAGDKLAGTRVIPLAVPEETVLRAEEIAGGAPILELLPYVSKTACIITTGSEVATGRIKDTFTPVVEDKLRAYGIEVVGHAMPGDEIEDIAAAINDARTKNPGMILCTGGMSVDPDDCTPGAIKRSGAEVVTYGTPVLPGAMFLLGYFDDGTAIMGLPGGVMYEPASAFDIVLPRVAAGVRMTKHDFAELGNGGLCLRCNVCIYPVCPFGKTI